MCTRRTGPRSEVEVLAVRSRTSLGCRRTVWSKMKMREAPVLNGGEKWL